MPVIFEGALALHHFQDFLADAGLALAQAIELGEKLVERDLRSTAGLVAAVDHGTYFRLGRQGVLHRVNELVCVGEVRWRCELRRGAFLGCILGEESLEDLAILDVLEARRRPVRAVLDLVYQNRENTRLEVRGDTILRSHM